MLQTVTFWPGEAAAFWRTGLKNKTIPEIGKGFELIGDVLHDFGAAIVECDKDAAQMAAKVKEIASALRGNVWSIIEVVASTSRHSVGDASLPLCSAALPSNASAAATVATSPAPRAPRCSGPMPPVRTIIAGTLGRMQPRRQQ